MIYHQNPYPIGRPIRSNEQEFFFGREEIFKFIKDNLLRGIGGKGGKVILLHGQRRIGKTSLLLQIPKAVDLDEFVFVQFDLQGRASQSLGNLLWQIAQQIKFELESQVQTTLALPQRLKESPSLFDSQFLPQVYQALGGKNLVLLLDEFDVLVDNTAPQEVAANRFFPYLQSIIQKQEQLFIIPVVGRQLDDIPGLLMLFKEAPHRRIGLLDQNSTKRLITEPVKDILTYEDDAIKAIRELSSGHPYCTQLLCYCVFSRARDQEFPPVKRQDVQAIINKAIESGELGFDWFWNGLPSIERVVLSAIAEAQQRDLAGDSWQVLRGYFTTEEGIIQSEPLRDAEEILKEGGFLTPSGEANTYRITVELVCRWLVQRHPLRQELRFYLETVDPTLPALVERAQILMPPVQLQEVQVLDVQEVLRLFGGETFELLKVLLSPIQQIVTSELKLIEIVQKILRLYQQRRRREQTLEECVSCVSQMAYLESLKGILALLDETEQQVLLNQIGTIPLYQLLARQLDWLESEGWKLDIEEAKKVFFFFARSKLAEILKSALEDQLERVGVIQNERKILINRVTYGTHQHVIDFFKLQENLAQQLVKNCSDKVGDEISKYQRAQQKWKDLTEKQKNKKISDYLTKELAKYTSINQYLKQEIDQKSVAQVFHEKFTFKDIYINLKVQSVNGSSRGEIDFQKDWAKRMLQDPNKQDQVMFVQSEPGQGKSVFCRMFANWVRQHLYPFWIPIWIQLQNIREIKLTFDQTLQMALAKWAFTKNDDQWLKEPNTRFLFLLDGLDELVTESHTDQGIGSFLQQVVDFQSNCWALNQEAGHRVLITSRGSLLEDLVLPVFKWEILPHLEQVEIRPIDEQLQQEWVKKWGKHQKLAEDQIRKLSQFLQNQEVETWAKEPLLLYLLAAMYRDGECQDIEQELKESSSQEAKITIYEKSLDWIIKRQFSDTLNQKLFGKNTQDLKKSQKEHWKSILAEAGLCAIQSNGTRAAMLMLEERLQNKGLVPRLIQASQRWQDDEDINTALVSFSIEPTSNSQGWIQFNHKSFSEFLYAKRLYESLINWTRQLPEREEFYIPIDRMDWEVYDLLGFGALTPEIVNYLTALLNKKTDFKPEEHLRRLTLRGPTGEVSYIKALLKKIQDLKQETFQPQKLLKQLQYFYVRWFKGDFINKELSETLARRKMQQLQKPLEVQGLSLGRRQIDVYTGLNVLILLLELHRYVQRPFCPCGEPDSEDFDPSRMLRLISYSRCLGAEVFVKTIGPFLTGIYLRNADLRGIDLYGVKLNQSYISSTILNGINLSGADIRNAFLGNAKLCRADLSGANLEGTFLGNADLSYASLKRANLSNTVLTGADFHTAFLANANLTRAFLGDADLSDANLRGANLEKADLSCANLSNADLTSAKLEDANLYGANLYGTNLSKGNLKNTKLRNNILSNVDLSNADLSGANLRVSILDGAILKGAKLRRAYLSGATIKGINLKGADLTNAFLRNAKLRRTDLSGADLKDTFLANADLSYASLKRAKLSNAFLGNAKLYRADLSGANLEDAFLGNTDLSYASLNKAKLSRAVLTGANLRHTNFLSSDADSVSDLSEAYLSDADSVSDLSEAYLGDADLSNANLQSANLQSADLSFANLRGTDLTGADLTGANLTGADLTGANLNGTTLKDVIEDESTVWEIQELGKARISDELRERIETRVKHTA